MAKSVNQVILLGRLTADVELRSTASGKNVASFSLAVDRNGEGADFFEITAWEKTAELLQQYTGKGSKILVQGRLQQESWDDKDSGKKRSKVTVVANDVTFLDSKQTSENASQDTIVEDIDDKPIDLSEIPF
jgi:single-strand DNA-binding protein